MKRNFITQSSLPKRAVEALSQGMGQKIDGVLKIKGIKGNRIRTRKSCCVKRSAMVVLNISAGAMGRIVHSCFSLFYYVHIYAFSCYVLQNPFIHILLFTSWSVLHAPMSFLTWLTHITLPEIMFETLILVLSHNNLFFLTPHSSQITKLHNVFLCTEYFRFSANNTCTSYNNFSVQHSIFT